MMRFLKWFLFSCFLLLAAGCSIFGIHFQIHNPHRAGSYRHDDTKAVHLLGTLTKYRTCFDVTHNFLQVNVDPSKRYLKGSNTMTAKVINDFDTLQVDLFKNLKMSCIVFEGKNLSWKKKEGAYFVAMPRMMRAGESFSLVMSYEGRPVVAKKPPWDGGFVWKKDKNDQPWIGVACETEGASLWWPCKDHNSDEADSTDMSITVPKGLVCVCNGHIRDSVNSEKTTTFNWHISYPINNYDVTLYIGKLKLLHDTYQSTVTGQTLDLNHYVLGYNYEKAQQHFKQVKQILGFYEYQFGAYPWYKDGYKLVESPYEGMEHQSAIAYGYGYKNSYGEDFDYIILHETAHEWWGNSITAADLADVWIQEGMATYAEALYVEKYYGRDKAINYLGTYRISIINRRPVVGPVGRRWFWYKDGDVYVKGAWMMHTLRTVINDDKLFFDILESFRETYNCKTVTSQDFIDWVNKKTGENYTWFFDQYLHNRFTPVLEYYMTYNRLYYRWVNVKPTFVMSIYFTMNGEDEEHILSPSTEVMELKAGDFFKTLYLSEDRQLFGVKYNSHLERMYKKLHPNEHSEDPEPK